MTELYVFTIGSDTDMRGDEMEALADKLGEAINDVGLDGEIVLINAGLESIEKEELLEELE